MKYKFEALDNRYIALTKIEGLDWRSAEGARSFDLGRCGKLRPSDGELSQATRETIFEFIEHAPDDIHLLLETKLRAIQATERALVLLTTGEPEKSRAEIIQALAILRGAA
jgi:hypothetical protein